MTPERDDTARRPKPPKTKARLEQLITQWQKDSGVPVSLTCNCSKSSTPTPAPSAMPVSACSMPEHNAAGSAALIGAGLLSVLIFPLTGLLLLKRGAPTPTAAPEPDGEPTPLMAM
jgi:hypothetical protein